LPLVQELLYRLTAIRELVFSFDGSDIGQGCITLMISVSLYGKRALPISWLVIISRKGHLPEHHLHHILPPGDRAIILGDGEFDTIEQQAALQTLEFQYVCHTAKNTPMYEGDLAFSFSDLLVQPDDLVSLPNLWFTKVGSGAIAIRKGQLSVAQVNWGPPSAPNGNPNRDR
jgi:hypothetical protein